MTLPTSLDRTCVPYALLLKCTVASSNSPKRDICMQDRIEGSHVRPVVHTLYPDALQNLSHSAGHSPGYLRDATKLGRWPYMPADRPATATATATLFPPPAQGGCTADPTLRRWVWSAHNVLIPQGPCLDGQSNLHTVSHSAPLSPNCGRVLSVAGRWNTVMGGWCTHLRSYFS